MQKLQNYSKLVNKLKNNCEFYELYKFTDKLLIN
jgi:hypothetical protein